MQRAPLVRRAVILFVAILGWVLFFYWWRKVALESTATAASVAVVVLLVVGIVVFYSTVLWIRHNLKLAKRGKRGFSTRWVRPYFDRDHLNRPLVFTQAAARQEGTWFVVHSDVKEKRYSHHRLTSVSAP
jgi:hypothetical protein